MSVAEVLSVGGAILTVASKIQDLAQDWYIVSEAYRSKVEDLRISLDTLGKQLHKHGLPLDGNMVKTLQKAELLLKKEEAKLEKVQGSGLRARVRRPMAKLDHVIFPRKLERTLQNVIDEIEKIPKQWQREAELAGVAREHQDSQPMSTIKDNIIDDDFYVPIEVSHSAVFNALNDPNGPPVTLLHGGPGKGKSTLAKYVHAHYCNDQGEMENKFEHVVWLACGHKADILVKQNEILQILDPKSSKESSSLEECQGRGGLDFQIKRPLQGLLHSQKILIILDDVWEEKFILDMWEVSGKSVRYLVTSQKANLCLSLPKKVLPITMETPTTTEARKILASHVGLEGNEIPPGNLQVIANQLLNKIDSNPLALASFASYFAYKKDAEEKLEEKEWWNAYDDLSSWLDSKNRKFVLGQTEGIESLWFTMGRSIELLDAGPSAKELLAFTYMCEGPSTPEQVLKTLFKSAKSVRKGPSGLFSLARDELNMRGLLHTSSQFIVHGGSNKFWSLHSLVQLYIQEKMIQEDIQSAINSLPIVRTEINPCKSETVQPQIGMKEAEIEKAKVVTALCALYFDHEHRDESIKGFANRAAVKLKIPIKDLTKLRIRRKAIEPVVWLLGEIDTLTGPLDRAEQGGKGQQALRYSKKVFLKYVCEQQLDFSSISALLTMVNFPSIVLAVLGALRDILGTEETPLFSRNDQSIVDDLSCLLKEDVEANIQESALLTLTKFIWRAISHENLMFPSSSMLGILEGLVRVLQDSDDRTTISKTYALNAMGYLTFKLGLDALQENAAAVLRNLAWGSDEAKMEILHHEGALDGLVLSLLKNENPTLQENAAAVLRNLAGGSNEAKMEILHHKGALDGLVLSLLRNENPALQENAAAVLRNLAGDSNEAEMKILHHEGALDGLVLSLLKNENPPLQENAAAVLRNLAWSSDEAKMEILHHEGALDGLVLSLHKDDNPALQKHAAAALTNLALGPDEAKTIMKEAKGISEGLLGLLAKHVATDTQYWAAYVITLINPMLGKKTSLVVGEAYFGRALANAIMGMYEDALSDLDQANLLQPRDAKILRLRCFVKVKLGDLNGALADSNEAIELRDEGAAFDLLERGVLRQIMGDLDGAVVDLSEALELECEKYSLYETLKHRGHVRFLMKDQEGARLDAERAMTVKPDDVPRGYMSLGQSSVEYLGYRLG